MEEKEILVKAEGVSKKFCMDLKTSLKYGVQDLFANFGRNDKTSVLREKEFWAVRDINFELRRGECLGLIGHNGAGKSTLLKILNGLINPDVGKVTIKGKVSALIELGAGFNPILSGRENIYNNGAILGFTREEINNKIEEIIDFAEIREFIDMPVQNYSSGMKVRLGFAIAAQLEPDVLIIDEVLAVGDLGFVLKCFKTIDSILPNTAIVFVSHSMPMIARICNQVILMEKGKSDYQGYDIVKGIGLYYNKFSNSNKTTIFDEGSIIFNSYILNNSNEKLIIKRGEDLIINLNFKIIKKLNFAPLIYLEFRDKEQRPIAGTIVNELKTKINSDELNYDITIKNVLFSLGLYSIDLSVSSFENKTPILRINNLISFQVNSENQMWVPIELESECNVY